MSIPTLEEFAEMLDKAIENIPERFIRSLTGGFNLEENKKRDGDYYIMGEYIEDGFLGCFIMFYYGSFKALLADEPLPVWEEEILDTVLHELQHHLESMAGRDDLAQKEMEELARALSADRGL